MVDFENTPLAFSPSDHCDPMEVKIDIFSRDCFPSPDNPSIKADEVINGCHDAKKYEDFYEYRFLEGAMAVEGAQAQLKKISGAICFCDDHEKCNDDTSVPSDDCVTSGAGSCILMSTSLVLIGTVLIKLYR